MRERFYIKAPFTFGYVHVRYVKSLFTNIQNQQNMLKISLLFKKFSNFTGKGLGLRMPYFQGNVLT